MNSSVVVRALCLGALSLAAASAPLSASAQQVWKWRDANGQIHISDQPPPAGASVLQKPAGGALVPSAEPAADASTAASAPSPGAKKLEAEIARRKAQADKEKADKEKADKAAQAQASAQQCAAAREQLRTIDSGLRLVRVNDKGEREFLDDNARAEQRRQAQAVADKACH